MYKKVNQKGGWRVEINDSSSTVIVNLLLHVAICNDSKDPNINQYLLANAMEQQLKLVYEINYHRNFVDKMGVEKRFRWLAQSKLFSDD